MILVPQPIGQLSVFVTLLLLFIGTDSVVSGAKILATGNRSPFLEYALDKLPPLDNSIRNNWKFLPGDYNQDGIVDMYCIKQQGGSTTEVHILNGADNYSSFLLNAASALEKTTSVDFDFALGDYNSDGKLDLWAIKKTAVTTEVHILNGSTQFKSWMYQSTTVLEPTNDNWSFHVADWNKDGKMDLVCIAMRGAVGTEVHVLDGKSGFNSFNLRTRTVLGFTDPTNWAFALADQNADKTPDLYCIKKNGSFSKTEVHVLNGATSFNRFLMQTKTALTQTGIDWKFHVADYDRDGTNDLLCFNTTPGGKIGFKFLRGSTIGYYWSDPIIWSGLAIPAVTDLAIIPAGRTVILDIPVVVNSIEIGGRLVVADQPGLSLTSDWIVVNDGELQIGTEAIPFRNKFSLKLTGTDKTRPSCRALALQVKPVSSWCKAPRPSSAFTGNLERRAPGLSSLRHSMSVKVLSS